MNKSEDRSMMGGTLSGISENLPRPILAAFAHAGHHLVMKHMDRASGLDIPVISVGNISFGGTAKTPTVEYIARRMVRKGYRPGIVLRGYLGRIDREKLDPAVVSDGRRVYLDWLDAGDEAVLLAEVLTWEDVPVAVGRNRRKAAQLLANKFGIDIVILDDGFQFTSLKRDFDLALIDALLPFGRLDGGLGLLREPVEALSRSDAILLTRSEAVDHERIGAITYELENSLDPLPPIFHARTVIKGLHEFGSVRVESARPLTGRKAVAFAGIGNPAGFEHTVKSLGVDLSGMMRFPDHHPYGLRDIEGIQDFYRDRDAEIILTTKKDAVRLRAWERHINVPMYLIDIEIRIEDDARLFDMLAEVINGASLRVIHPVSAAWT